MNLSEGEYLRQRQLLLVFFILLSSCFGNFSFGQVLGPQAARLPDNEVEALKEIEKTLGKTDWNFSVNPCSGQSGWNTIGAVKGNENYVTCNCNSTICHVTEIVLKSQNLPGVLPPELVKLPFLETIDLTRNYLNGTIPKEWGSMQLKKISLSANRLSGPIPKEIGSISSLLELVLEFNQLSGVLPLELGKLVGIKRIVISSNNFTGGLPDLSGLTNLEKFGISDNRFTGKLPNFMEKWTKLEKLEIQASGFEGPIPSGIFLLEELEEMWISDLNGTGAHFPAQSKMKKMLRLILRSCNITGTLPEYLGQMPLRLLDLSFNKLTGEIPISFARLGPSANFLYLTGNLLSGPVPEWMLKEGKTIDLSYNNFTLGGSKECQERNVNLFGSSSLGSNSGGIIQCLKNFHCPRTWYSFHINCGGKEANVNGRDGITTYKEDAEQISSSRSYIGRGNNWAFSNTGNFLGDNNDIESYVATNNSILSMDDSQLYTTARLSPLSLTYYGFCLENESYNVSLHFAEIMFTNDRTFNSLGRRIFDVYIQGKIVLKDFNIAEEAGGAGKAVIKRFTAVVTRNTLEIRFAWAGRGTSRIPTGGTYGPLISAISVTPNFEPPSPSEDGKKMSAGAVVGIVASVLCFILMILGIVWWKGCFQQKNEIDQELRDLDPNTGSFTLKLIKAATNNFNAENKIGEGGFGPVYKDRRM